MKSWGTYLEFTKSFSESIDVDSLNNCAQELMTQIREGKPILTAGNGGSATTADHFAADLSLLRKRTGNRCKALCLNSHLGLNTALSNDLGYETALVEQFLNFIDEDPLVITFSASGNSRNLLNLLDKATSQKVKIWSFVGFDGGATKKLADSRVIHFSTPLGEYGQVENVQLLVCHFLVDILIEEFTI
jgi:D-sedoheptulose 7-phosphate isomerase